MDVFYAFPICTLNNNDNVQVMVALDDVNDNVPVFSQSKYEASVNEYPIKLETYII